MTAERQRFTNPVSDLQIPALIERRYSGNEFPEIIFDIFPIHFGWCCFGKN
jgi:hypothetical protein